MRLACLLLLVACSKVEPAAPAPGSNAPTGPAPQRVVAKPAPKLVAPEQQRTAPALPDVSDINPPNVPKLTGPVQQGERGLQYIDEVVGTGPSPMKGQKIQVHYTGWLTDGTKFDSSRDRGDPIALSFDTGQVIPGWDLGLASMKVGGKRRLLLPAEIAYGSHGAGDAIPPDAILVFDVELVAIE